MKLAEITPVFNYNKSVNRNGESALHLRIYHNGKRKLIGLGIHVKPTQWDNRNGKVKGHLRKDEYNNRIKSEINRIRDNESKFVRGEKKYTIPDIISYTSTNQTNLTFNEFVKKDLKGRADLKPGTIRNHEVFINRLNEFNSNIEIDSINFQFLKDFESFLRKYEFTKGEITKKLELTRVVKYLKQLNAYVKRAIRFNYLEERADPFKYFNWSEYSKAERQASKKRRYLDPEDVTRLEKLVFNQSNIHQERIRDFFIIQCYSGLPYGDMVSLGKKHIKEVIREDGGGLVISKQRVKTGESLYIPVYMIDRNAENLIRKYLGEGRKYLFDNLTSEYINRELKKIGTAAGIDKTITTHVGRHTFAMMMLHKKIPLEIVSKILGHSDLRTTRIYTEINEDIINNSLRKLANDK